ncbi:hypothetical protein NDU88_004914 [Pleurodeles waltl]|uniref:Uncharacterized protein n=1 Tax=Pleurodeles waltl TaxID=8319 RepID=A0AAV7V4D1_PLEWA|nr:hypothetical protein NDU88_004914 [Pleurodeles waltl]
MVGRLTFWGSPVIHGASVGLLTHDEVSSRALQKEARGGSGLRWSAGWVPGAALACASLRGGPWFVVRCARASAAPVASTAGGRAGSWPVNLGLANLARRESSHWGPAGPDRRRGLNRVASMGGNVAAVGSGDEFLPQLPAVR